MEFNEKKDRFEVNQTSKGSEEAASEIHETAERKSVMITVDAIQQILTELEKRFPETKFSFAIGIAFENDLTKKNDLFTGNVLVKGNKRQLRVIGKTIHEKGYDPVGALMELISRHKEEGQNG